MQEIQRNFIDFMIRVPLFIAFGVFLHLCKVRYLYFFGSYLWVTDLKIPNTVFLHIC